MRAALAALPLTAVEQLDMARDAWTRAETARREMERLKGYRSMTVGMRRDYNAASRAYHEQRALHDRIMRGDL